jgi:hypothetical protein
MFMNDLEVRQVLALSGQGFGAKDISGQLGLEELDVKLALRTQDSGTEEDRDITDAELKVLRKNAFVLATQAEDESVQAQMTRFLIERDKPTKVAAPAQGINPMQINIMIQEANKRMAETIQAYTTPTISNV